MLRKPQKEIVNIIVMLMDEYINCPLTNRHLLINNILFWKDLLGSVELSDILPNDLLMLLDQITRHQLSYSHQDASNIIKKHAAFTETHDTNQEISVLLEIATYLFSQKNSPNLQMAYTADNIISLIELKLQITSASDQVTLGKRVAIIRKSLKKHKWTDLCEVLDKFQSLPNFKKRRSCSKDDFTSHESYLKKHSKKIEKTKKEEPKVKKQPLEDLSNPTQDGYQQDKNIDKNLLATALSTIKEIINSPGDMEGKIGALQNAFNDVERILGVVSPGNSINQNRISNITNLIENSSVFSDNGQGYNGESIMQDIGMDKLFTDILDHSGVDMHHLKVKDDHDSIHTPSEMPNVAQKTFSQESMNKLLESKKNHE